MKIRLYALLLEDVKRDAEFLEEILTDNGFDLEMDLVDNEADFISNLKRHNYDIIYADFTLPAFNGQAALEVTKKMCPNIPFICISGTIGEDRAVELLKQGATDYVLKDRMERVPMATKRALEAASQLNKFRETEIELQTNRRLLQSIINNALDSIYIKDINGKYLLFNYAAEKTFGVKESDVIGKDDSFIFSEAHVQMVKEIDKKVIESGVPYTYEDSITSPDGIVRVFQTIKCPMYDDFGNATGLFGIARDITERKNLEYVLTEAKEKAEDSNRLKTAFLNNISHEIRTPMNAIIGFSDFLKTPELPIDKRIEYIDIISTNCYQLLDIINDIVITASLASGQVKLNISRFNINIICENLYSQFEPKAQLKNIVLDYVCPFNDSDAYIRSDEIKLTHILSCLINNAVKFTKQGNINFGYTLKGDELEFYIEDTGIGISPEKQELIFERFRQAERSTAYEFGGTGLGLTISKGYVELLGGKIWLSSNIGKGSKFFFTIPYTKTI
jgi:PAS domain S-box-containing protein